MTTTTPAPVDTLPDLGDTRIAFAHKSNGDLWRAQQLFRIIGNPHITAVCSWVAKAALALRLPIKWAIKLKIF